MTKIEPMELNIGDDLKKLIEAQELSTLIDTIYRVEMDGKCKIPLVDMGFARKYGIELTTSFASVLQQYHLYMINKENKVI